MAEYRAYFVGEDGQYLRSVDLVCPDDETAKTYAVQLVDGTDIELWRDGRKIAGFRSSPR